MNHRCNSLKENQSYSPLRKSGKFTRNNSENCLTMNFCKENSKDMISKRKHSLRKLSESGDSFEDSLNEEENTSILSSPDSVRSGSVRSITSMSTNSEVFPSLEERKKVGVWMQSDEIRHMMEVECTEGTTIMSLAKLFNKELQTLY